MKMFIGGSAVNASDGAEIDVINPATHQVIDKVPSATKEDVDGAVEKAHLGFLEWSAVPLFKRIEIMYNYTNILEDRLDELIALACRESGKAITLCRAEAKQSVEVFRCYAEKARNFGGETMPIDSEERVQYDFLAVIREPLGVVGCVIPFNYPMELYAHKVAPALVVGNSVIIKPSSDTPLANILMTQWLLEAGVPSNAIQIVTGPGAKVGKYLVENPIVKLITLTGSTKVGIETMGRGSNHLHRCLLELGGNDPLIIFDDCDLDKAVQETIEGRCSNAGQTCCANKRMIVQNSIKIQFIEKLLEGLKKVKVGDPEKEDTTYGPLINENAAQDVLRNINHTIEQGAKCIYGGKLFNRTFIEPTLLTDVTPDMDIAQSMEVFGPVFPVIGFDTLEEAVEIANNIPYGLQGGVMTSDMKKAFKVAKSLLCGCCVINGNGNYRSMHQPFGGYKMSGIGREGVVHTLEEFTQKKTIAFKAIFK
ncbi:MAG: aldehyde dehydrogenase family protein [Tannerellaceae bacterium]|jgi:succinate-semialdehyde dehydrogenase/glutarate-semialdehyde dehydrogenase|nr:aldehyde dehydrogenase family protein [Tannerellaceae bacterium]